MHMGHSFLEIFPPIHGARLMTFWPSATPWPARPTGENAVRFQRLQQLKLVQTCSNRKRAVSFWKSKRVGVVLEYLLIFVGSIGDFNTVQSSSWAVGGLLLLEHAALSRKRFRISPSNSSWKSFWRRDPESGWETQDV